MSRGRRPKDAFRYLERSDELRAVLKGQRIDVLKISRRELSLRCGVSAATIQAIEDGRVREPGLFTVIAIGIALNLDLGPMMRSLTGRIRPKPLVEHPVAADGNPAHPDDATAVR